jgi:hypothetical protein
VCARAATIIVGAATGRASNISVHMWLQPHKPNHTRQPYCRNMCTPISCSLFSHYADWWLPFHSRHRALD